MKKLNFRLSSVETAALVFLYSSVFIFLFAWLKIYFAIPCAAAIIFGFYKFKKTTPGNKSKAFKIGRGVFIAAAIFFFLSCIAAGIGGFTYQSSDWSKHNAVLRDLINYSWPVYYPGNPDRAMLTYYVTSYLIPALVGKATGILKLAEFAQLVWASCGFVIFFLLAVKYTKASTNKRQLFLAFLCVFFSTFSVSAAFIIQKFYPDLTSSMFYNTVAVNHSKSVFLQYTSNFDAIAYVFTQAIPLWICSMMFFNNKSNRQNYVFIMIPLAFYSTLCFAGLAATAMLYAAVDVVKDKFSAKVLKEIFSLSNILLASVLGGTVLAFFGGNVFSKKPEKSSFSISSLLCAEYLPVLLIFIFFGVGIYFLFFFKKNKKDTLFWISFAALFILPLFNMGFNNDLLLRGSQCALLYLMLMFADFMFDTDKHKRTSLILFTFFAFNAIFHVFDAGAGFIIHTNESIVYKERDTYQTMGEYTSKNGSPVTRYNWVDMEALCYNYFTYDTEDDFFVQHLARTKTSTYTERVQKYENDEMYSLE